MCMFVRESPFSGFKNSGFNFGLIFIVFAIISCGNDNIELPKYITTTKSDAVTNNCSQTIRQVKQTKMLSRSVVLKVGSLERVTGGLHQ